MILGNIFPKVMILGNSFRNNVVKLEKQKALVIVAGGKSDRNPPAMGRGLKMAKFQKRDRRKW